MQVPPQSKAFLARAKDSGFMLLLCFRCYHYLTERDFNSKSVSIYFNQTVVERFCSGLISYIIRHKDEASKGRRVGVEGGASEEFWVLEPASSSQSRKVDRKIF